MATMVKLYSKELDEVREHDIEHANRIWKLQNHGWELKDKDFKEHNGLIVRNNTGAGKTTNKPGNTEHSGKA